MEQVYLRHVPGPLRRTAISGDELRRTQRLKFFNAEVTTVSTRSFSVDLSTAQGFRAV